MSYVPYTSGGWPAWFAIEPALLPTGLNFEARTGAIYGTPSESIRETRFEVKASNDAGAATGALWLLVLDLPPESLNYAAARLSCVVHRTCALAGPSNAGGKIDVYSIAPVLPAGLALDPSTGSITGSASEVSSLKTYTVTGENNAGVTTTGIEVVVSDVGL